MVRANRRSRTLLATLVASFSASQAGAIAVDVFDDGTFAFCHDQSAARREQQPGSMLGGSRIVSLSTERRETTLSASVPAGSSQLFFDTGTGLAGGLSAGRLTLTYGTGFFDLAQDPLDVDLSGFDRFLFDVRQLQGEGELIVLVNGHVIGGGSAFIPLTTSGTVVYPFNAVNLQSGDFSDVDNVDFVIRGQTTDFSVAIGGISVVPEPATLLLILLGLGALSVGRERTGRSPENGRSRA